MTAHPRALPRELQLLSRDDFRNGVFARDGHRCVLCDEPAVDAHHILERRLWPDGGYYLANGASVCGSCHLRCEETLVDCETLRQKCGITHVHLPPHLYPDETWDKWGNMVLPNGQRLQGELFYDASVQKVLAPVLHLFTNRVRYPRTYHLPWSPGKTKDDRELTDLTPFEGEEVVVTVKLDGENTTFYRDGLHARSLSYDPHPSRNRVRALQATLAADLPEDVRLCGENLFAKHSIHYQNLPSFFVLFSVWQRHVCLSWDDTLEWAALLDLPTVPVLYRGPWDLRRVREEFPALTTHDGDPMEGFVVRLARSFSYSEFRRVVGKWVRPYHNTTGHAWLRQQVVPNGLRPR